VSLYDELHKLADALPNGRQVTNPGGVLAALIEYLENGSSVLGLAKEGEEAVAKYLSEKYPKQPVPIEISSLGDINSQIGALQQQIEQLKQAQTTGPPAPAAHAVPVQQPPSAPVTEAPDEGPVTAHPEQPSYDELVAQLQAANAALGHQQRATAVSVPEPEPSE
jgi:hypothetical protein